MEAAIELTVQRALPIMDDHFLRMKVSKNDKVIKESCSEDAFGFFGMITAGKRLAGLARKKYYNPCELMGELFESDPAIPVNLGPVEQDDDLKLIVETNIWLDPGMMVQDVLMSINSDEKTFVIPLNSPEVKVNWLKRGTFAIDIADFIKK